MQIMESSAMELKFVMEMEDALLLGMLSYHLILLSPSSIISYLLSSSHLFSFLLSVLLSFLFLSYHSYIAIANSNPCQGECEEETKVCNSKSCFLFSPSSPFIFSHLFPPFLPFRPRVIIIIIISICLSSSISLLISLLVCLSIDGIYYIALHPPATKSSNQNVMIGAVVGGVGGVLMVGAGAAVVAFFVISR